MNKYLQHVTLNTGHNLPFNGADCDPAVIEIASSLLDFALEQGTRVSLPDGELSHLSFECKSQGRKLSIVAYGPMAPHVKGKPFDGDNVVPIAICAVSPKSKDSDVWATLTESYETIYKKPCSTQRPQAPWLGVVLTPMLSLFEESVDMLADFERCIAWAWMQKLGLI